MANLFGELFKKPADISSELEKQIDFDEITGENPPVEFMYGTSDFKKEQVLREYYKVKESISNHKNINKLITIDTIYRYNGFEGIEIGIFLTNTTENPVELYAMNLGLFNEDGIPIRQKYLDFKGEITINPNSSLYYEILFENVHVQMENVNLKVGFLDTEELKVSYIKELNVDSAVSKSLSEEVKDFLREKFFDIPQIRHGEISLDPILAIGREDGINVIILARNASDRDVTLNSIPIKICMKEDLPIYVGNLNFNEDSIILNSDKCKLLNISVNQEFVPVNIVKDYIYKLKIGK
ncbi:SLAP domain-containing protein [Hathewaya proteolytica DSM 3090]|uniref:SLAP domain-containing protein n=1 Tax=Hathewaya proteolytica DSM 3090 TaxID=1121331 RepID=A0A1M6PLB0_9CLOT|nr:SLAP domain-containing protein [Hathewaya proteolytica]SHK08647.1 SLAP domain-containing protein [Hathewaya proteolytica DSM 3090]